MTTDRTPAEPPRTVALVCPSCGSSYWSPEWEHCGACGTALKPYMEVVGLVVERELLSAQLAEQRSINAARESENAAQVEALRHIVGLGSSVPLGMDPESFYHLEMNEAIKTAAWALHPDPSKAATEWRTQVAKEAVEAERERLDSVVTSLREALYAAIMTFEGGAELGLTPDQMYQAAKSLETTPGLFASDSTPGAALSPEQPEVTE